MAILRSVEKCIRAILRTVVITFLMQNQRNLVVSVKPWLEREGTYASL